MAAKFTFKDNSTQVFKAVIAQLDDAADQLKQELVEAVQTKILYGYKDPHGPDGHTEIVDTGRLFDSIDANVKRVSQNTVDIEVGTNDVPYAIYVHNGTRKLKGRPFIRDTLREQQSHIRDVIKNALSK